METQQIGSRLTEYVQLFQEAKRLVNDESVAAVILEQIGKDSRMQRIIDERQNGNGFANTLEVNGEQHATKKQLGYLKVLGVDVPAGLTKQRASELIDESRMRVAA